MQIAYYLENVGRLIASRQGVSCFEIKSKRNFLGLWWKGSSQWWWCLECWGTKTPDTGSRIMIASGCRSDRKVVLWTELSWAPTLCCTVTFLLLMPESFGVSGLLHRPAKQYLFPFILSTSLVLPAFANSINNYLFGFYFAMSWKYNSKITHTYTYLHAHTYGSHMYTPTCQSPFVEVTFYLRRTGKKCVFLSSIKYIVCFP